MIIKPDLSACTTIIGNLIQVKICAGGLWEGGLDLLGKLVKLSKD